MLQQEAKGRGKLYTNTNEQLKTGVRGVMTEDQVNSNETNVQVSQEMVLYDR